MPFLHGMYNGVRKRLKFETAFLQEVPGGYTAQFDKMKHKEAFGWTFFPKKDFKAATPLNLWNGHDRDADRDHSSAPGGEP